MGWLPPAPFDSACIYNPGPARLPPQSGKLCASGICLIVDQIDICPIKQADKNSNLE